MSVFIPIPMPQFLVYVAAHQLLRPVLGDKTPTVIDLFTMEVTHRRARTIAEEYLDFTGHPSLNSCRRKLAERRRGAAKTKSDRGALAGDRAARRLRSRRWAPGDPSRN